MNPVIIIPARYQSSRFPGKPLCIIEGKSMIRRVWEICSKAIGAENVFVATDDLRIKDHCDTDEMQVVMTPKECLTGTDRVAEAYEILSLGHDIIVNVQGDEPLVDPDDILRIICVCEEQNWVCCGMNRIDTVDELEDKNTIKVVFDKDDYLLYASRSPIPFSKNGYYKDFDLYKQVCIYAIPSFKLRSFKSFTKGRLEAIEDIEILRFVERGELIKMVEVSSGSISVDTIADANRVAASIRLWNENLK